LEGEGGGQEKKKGLREGIGCCEKEREQRRMEVGDWRMARREKLFFQKLYLVNKFGGFYPFTGVLRKKNFREIRNRKIFPGRANIIRSIN
jgi:hypothetical protein